jgi:hypothetical protein
MKTRIFITIITILTTNLVFATGTQEQAQKPTPATAPIKRELEQQKKAVQEQDPTKIVSAVEQAKPLLQKIPILKGIFTKVTSEQITQYNYLSHALQKIKQDSILDNGPILYVLQHYFDNEAQLLEQQGYYDLAALMRGYKKYLEAITTAITTYFKEGENKIRQTYKQLSYKAAHGISEARNSISKLNNSALENFFITLNKDFEGIKFKLEDELALQPTLMMLVSLNKKIEHLKKAILITQLPFQPILEPQSIIGELYSSALQKISNLLSSESLNKEKELIAKLISAINNEIQTNLEALKLISEQQQKYFGESVQIAFEPLIKTLTFSKMLLDRYIQLIIANKPLRPEEKYFEQKEQIILIIKSQIFSTKIRELLLAIVNNLPL